MDNKSGRRRENMDHNTAVIAWLGKENMDNKSGRRRGIMVNNTAVIPWLGRENMDDNTSVIAWKGNRK